MKESNFRPDNGGGRSANEMIAGLIEELIFSTASVLTYRGWHTKESLFCTFCAF